MAFDAVLLLQLLRDELRGAVEVCFLDDADDAVGLMDGYFSWTRRSTVAVNETF